MREDGQRNHDNCDDETDDASAGLKREDFLTPLLFADEDAAYVLADTRDRCHDDETVVLVDEHGTHGSPYHVLFQHHHTKICLLFRLSISSRRSPTNSISDLLSG